MVKKINKIVRDKVEEKSTQGFNVVTNFVFGKKIHKESYKRTAENCKGIKELNRWRCNYSLNHIFCTLKYSCVLVLLMSLSINVFLSTFGLRDDLEEWMKQSKSSNSSYSIHYRYED